MKKIVITVRTGDDNLDPQYLADEVASRLEDEYGIGGPEYSVDVEATEAALDEDRWNAVEHVVWKTVNSLTQSNLNFYREGYERSGVCPDSPFILEGLLSDLRLILEEDDDRTADLRRQDDERYENMKEES